jgi:hypothetical protein
MKGKKTGGRQKGTPNKRSRKFLQSREQAAAVLEGVIPNAFKGDAHTYLMAAAPYEKPKLASTEFKGDPDSQVQHKLQIEFVRSPHSED